MVVQDFLLDNHTLIIDVLLAVAVAIAFIAIS